ncbi:PH domain-containing protein [Metabacillus sp. RGM 3146]|uniref:PH domain-containing protein n=1 Tax=Metabacillus sp. RGM 3146 TaxID=3401092 RepID=UPI003B9AF390
MGLFSASKSSDTRSFESLLIEGESIEAVYKLRIDQICFTDRRVIFFDNKLFSRKKARVFVPYKSIESFAIEEAGLFDLDAELLLMTKNQTFQLEFSKNTDMTEIQAILTKNIV